MKILRSDIYENLRMALSTLLANKLRSFLTVFGVVIGVITVMLIASIISGIDVSVKKEVESFGTRSIFISKFTPGIHVGRRSREERMRKELTYDDAVALQTCRPSKFQFPSSTSPTTSSDKNCWFPVAVRRRQGSPYGTLPEFERAGTQVISEGRFFTQSENDTKQDVCVIGSKVADDFFRFGSPVGQTIKIGADDFRVVGVLQKREQFLISGGSDDQNNVIYLPYEVARKLKPNADDVYIMAVGRPGMMDEAEGSGARHVTRGASRVCGARQLWNGDRGKHPRQLSLDHRRSGDRHGCDLLGGFDGGGIGVMNIMLVSVTERTREIGVRKAIGAKRSDIMWQFLIEAATLTGIGGIVGLSIGWLLTLLLSLLLPSYVPLWAPIGGLVASVGIGLIFGLWPAWKAARLDPIESLRYE